MNFGRGSKTVSSFGRGLDLHTRNIPTKIEIQEKSLQKEPNF